MTHDAHAKSDYLPADNKEDTSEPPGVNDKQAGSHEMKTRLVLYFLYIHKWRCVLPIKSLLVKQHESFPSSWSRMKTSN